MCGAIRMTLKCERSEHYINERWCYEQTDRRSAMIYHRICEAYICELLKKERLHNCMYTTNAIFRVLSSSLSFNLLGFFIFNFI